MKRKMNIKQVIAFSTVSLLCAIPIAMGVMILLAGGIVNISLVITYFLLPIAVIVGLFFVIRASWTTLKKSVVSVCLIFLGAFLVVQLMMIGYFELLFSETGEKAAESYETDDTVHVQMPSLDEIGEPIDLEYHDYYSQMSLFTCDSDVLIATYNEVDYVEQKILLEEKYTFVDAPLTACGYSCDPECILDGYLFRAVELGEGFWYPKHVMMIATNDKTHEIVYLCFYDDDLDYIESLDEFLEKDCGWEHIR